MRPASNPITVYSCIAPYQSSLLRGVLIFGIIATAPDFPGGNASATYYNISCWLVRLSTKTSSLSQHASDPLNMDRVEVSLVVEHQHGVQINLQTAVEDAKRTENSARSKLAGGEQSRTMAATDEDKVAYWFSFPKPSVRGQWRRWWLCGLTRAS